MPDFAAARAIMAATRKILSTTHAILALTWFCHLRMYLWSLGGAWGAPRGDPPPYTWKKLQCLKMIFRPFGEKKIKKNWIWKMTLADPPPSYGIFHKYFFLFFLLNPSLIDSLTIPSLGGDKWNLRWETAQCLCLRSRYSTAGRQTKHTFICNASKYMCRRIRKHVATCNEPITLAI